MWSDCQTGPRNMHRGFFSLAGAVSTMGQEVTDGDAFVFVNGNRRRYKYFGSMAPDFAYWQNVLTSAGFPRRGIAGWTHPQPCGAGALFQRCWSEFKPDALESS
ncbi:MAG: transposase [Deltaproteobacteria bacterium]|nr:transposase [Deltaproteobacteria bacterium]